MAKRRSSRPGRPTRVLVDLLELIDDLYTFFRRN